MTVREGLVACPIRFGTTALISWEFEMVFTHGDRSRFGTFSTLASCFNTVGRRTNKAQRGKC